LSDLISGTNEPHTLLLQLLQGRIQTLFFFSPTYEVEEEFSLHSARPSVCPSARLMSFPHLFCSCIQIFFWYLVYIALQIEFEFGFCPLVFTKLWPLDLEKKIWNISFPQFVVPYIKSFAVSDSYKSKLSFVMPELFSTELYRRKGT
jgi:hypothetical protein